MSSESQRLFTPVRIGAVELKNRIVHIPHDVECTSNLPKLREPTGSVFRLLSVCRLVPKKGLDTVLHALAQLQSETPDRYRYRILGGGPERRRLIQLVRSLKLNRVEFVGPVSPDTVQKELIELARNETHAEVRSHG